MAINVNNKYLKEQIADIEKTLKSIAKQGAKAADAGDVKKVKELKHLEAEFKDELMMYKAALGDTGEKKKKTAKSSPSRSYKPTAEEVAHNSVLENRRGVRTRSMAMGLNNG